MIALSRTSQQHFKHAVLGDLSGMPQIMREMLLGKGKRPRSMDGFKATIHHTDALYQDIEEFDQILHDFAHPLYGLILARLYNGTKVFHYARSQMSEVDAGWIDEVLYAAFDGKEIPTKQEAYASMKGYFRDVYGEETHMRLVTWQLGPAHGKRYEDFREDFATHQHGLSELIEGNEGILSHGYNYKKERYEIKSDDRSKPYYFHPEPKKSERLPRTANRLGEKLKRFTKPSYMHVSLVYDCLMPALELIKEKSEHHPELAYNKERYKNHEEGLTDRENRHKAILSLVTMRELYLAIKSAPLSKRQQNYLELTRSAMAPIVKGQKLELSA